MAEINILKLRVEEVELKASEIIESKVGPPGPRGLDGIDGGRGPRGYGLCIRFPFLEISRTLL